MTETAGFRKSSHSINGGNCVEVAANRRAVLVRDTKDRGGAVLTVPARAWSAFTGQFTGTGDGQ